MIAEFPGRCTYCGDTLEPGQAVDGTRHSECAYPDDVTQCSATTRRGTRCPTPTRNPSGLCHVHDPDGKFQRQRRAAVSR